MIPSPRHLICYALWITGLCLGASEPASGVGAPNGNDFALFYTEARSMSERETLLQEAGRRPHFFRYLMVLEMDEEEPHGSGPIQVVALEPASLLEVQFTVNQRVSLSVLREDPPIMPGQALAVSGVIHQIDDERGVLYLQPAIVRHRDRPDPVPGREMMYDLDDRARFYSFTGGREPVSLSYRDRDLLRHRDRILSNQGDQAWADFLLREIARRDAARRREATRP